MTRHVTWDRGVAVPEHRLWLDPETSRPLAVVTHAHSDHARRHQEAVLTPGTLALTPPRRQPRKARLLDFGEPLQLGPATLTLHDAGHMLGSSQVLIQTDGSRLLYSGDLKLRCGRSLAIPRADVLVIESTYGRPVFRFPDRDTIIEEVARWCARTLAEGVTPVLLCHAIGKAQEVMLALASHGLTFALEERCLPADQAYEAAGNPLPDHIPLVPGQDYSGRVVICPPAGKGEIRKLHHYRSALISGWAQDPTFRAIFGADVAFPLSDHCDFAELLEVVDLVQPEHVYTVHGFADDLAREFRRRGIRSSALKRSEQLTLALA